MRASLIALVASLTLSHAAFASKIQVVDIRSEEPPIYCHSAQDYQNRLTNLFPSSPETADHFRLKNLHVSAQGKNLVIQAKVDFVSCVKTANGYVWSSHGGGKDNYNLLAAPRSVLGDFVTGYLAPINSSTSNVTVSIPIEKYLTNQQDFDAYHDGKSIYGKEIYTTFLPKSFNTLRQNPINPAIRIFVDILQ